MKRTHSTRRRRSGRLVFTLLVAGTLVAGMAGCGMGGGSDEGPEGSGPVKEPTEPVTITFSSWVGNEAGMKRLYAKFRKKHPNITVEFQNVPAEQSQQKLTTQLAGGNPPDTAYVDAGTVGAFASRNALLNLDNYLERSELIDPDEYVEAFKSFVTYENSMYGLPFDGESTGLFYRTDMFEAAGIEHPPTTWEEFEAAAKALTKPEKKQYGFQLFAPEAAYYWYPWLWQAGGELLTKDQKAVAFDSPAGKRAAEFYVGLKEYSTPDYLNSNSYDGRVAFANGQVGMYVAGAWFAGVLEDEFPKISGKWASAPLPEGEAGCATTIAGDALVIFANSDHPDAAWKWIEFLGSPENVAEWTYKSEGTLLPPIQSQLDSPELIEEKPVLEGFAEAMACGRSNIITNEKWGQVEEALGEELSRAIYGEKSATEAIEDAAAKGNEILAED
ncbi:MAG TPA: sugar ABC transporter substrate-binding protein [Actinopolymorphaceae bacterium]